MANVSKINGFRPVKYQNGAAWNGQVTRYYVTSGDATALCIGDLVKIDGGSDGAGVRSVTRYAVTGPVCGAVVGVEPDATALNTPQYRTASTTRYVYVADDPNILFEVESNGSTGFATADVGLNAEVSVAAGSTFTGASGFTIDSSTTGTTATLTLKVVELVQRPDNAVGQYSKWLVKLQSHQLASGSGTAGI